MVELDVFKRGVRFFIALTTATIALVVAFFISRDANRNSVSPVKLFTLFVLIFPAAYMVSLWCGKKLGVLYDVVKFQVSESGTKLNE